LDWNLPQGGGCLLLAWSLPQEEVVIVKRGVGYSCGVGYSS